MQTRQQAQEPGTVVAQNEAESGAEVSGEQPDPQDGDATEGIDDQEAIEESATPEYADVPPELLYKLLLAEIAGQRGQFSVAVDGLLGAAWESEDPRVAKRAARVAIYAKDYEAAVKAAKRWEALAPEDADAVKHVALLSLRQGDVDTAADELIRFVDMVAGESSRRLDVIVTLLKR
ncbi:MAG: hypothetical protein ACPG4N_07075, partial [Gammaproteobacteria bacterium]